MTHRIIRYRARPAVAVVQALGAQGVATVHEAQGRTGLMRPYLRPIYSAARVAGPAVTVSCPPGDNLMIHAAIELCKHGDVLVVSPTSASTDGMFGELLATSCLAHGVAGLVIDAGVRDVTEISALGFPIWAKAISAQGTVKASAGSINIEIVCAGAVVRPGDVVVGDEDGVVVVPRARAADVCQSGVERMAREEATRARLRAGELGLDFYGLRAKLKELGVQYTDEEEHDG
jgi:4-hydroxy-4-methyl-2-oxoglutarate aldolase